ncbi:MAG: cytochrome P450 [Actinobacteria bacterium]|nr:cytochrome P450 [Actinomycetota bacterium]
MIRAVAAEVILRSWSQARSALRNRDLRQGLYDEGTALMGGVIVNLHDSEHTARRRLENRLFRRDTFAFWEKGLIPKNITDSIIPHIAHGNVDLVQLARLTMMRISAGIAGIDLGTDQERFTLLANVMGKLARASSVNHFLGDKAAVIEDGNVALDLFDKEFYTPARARRLDIIARSKAGEISESELPRDVLTTLLLHQDQLAIPESVVLREIAYFPWVGSHSTSGAFVNLMDHVFRWIDAHPHDRHLLADDITLIQRFGFESLRLHPASPESVRIAVSDTTIDDHGHVPMSTRVVIDMQSANRDPIIFGHDAHEFNPLRTVPDDVSPWGLSFGSGFHACIGQELVTGLENTQEPSETALSGAIATMAHIVLRHGATPDPDRTPRRDEQSVRQNWLEYPVVFNSR